MRPADLAKYLLLPLRTASLLVIVLFAALLSIAESAGMMGLPLRLILTSWFFKYSFVLLDHVIEGRHEPPTLSVEMVNPVEQRPFGLLLLLGVIYWASLGLEQYVGAPGVWVLRIAVLVLVPAMVAAMSVTGSFFAALNPVAVIGIVLRVPIPYVTVLITIAVLWIVPFGLLRAIGVAGALPNFVSTGLFMYLWFAMFSCIGGVMYEHRDALGIEPIVSPERAAAKQQAQSDRDRDRVMDGIFAEVRGGALGNAGVRVRSLIDQSPEPLTEFRWLYSRAANWPDQRLAAYLVQLCLPKLLAARANGEALDLVRERLRHDADFRPVSAGQLVQVAALARDAGDLRTARNLVADFELRFPNNAAAVLVTKLRVEIAR